MKHILSKLNMIFLFVAVVPMFAQNGKEFNGVNSSHDKAKQDADIQVDIGIGDEGRKESARLLDSLLANEYVLFTKLLKYHWNVQGMAFGPLHDLFQDQYTALFDVVDNVAERIRAIGHIAPGTLQEFSQLTSLQEEPGKNPSQQDMIADLLGNHEVIIKQLRSLISKTEELGDMGTNDFVNGLLGKHEKQAWMLRAHLST